MTKRIFRSICVVALSVFAASVALFLFVLYNYFQGVQENQLRLQTELVSHAVANEGAAYLKDLDTGEYRVTWIGTDGEVLFDNRTNPDQMENHLEREEIREALSNGSGESIRYSSTLMERVVYSAKRLPDGSVIRLSIFQNTVLTLLLGMMQPICLIIVIAVVLALLLAFRLSRRIVRPLNALDLREPLDNDIYDELAPMLNRIDSQQRQIRYQREELAQKQSEFDAVTENMTEGIILLNRSGDILGINRAAMRLFGADPSCIGQNLLEVNRSMPIADLLQRAAEGRSAEKMLDLAGERYQLLLNPVVSGNLLSGSVLLAINVTEKERSEQLRREFTANVSHELKTPLQTIAGSAELLENGMVREEDQMGFYTRIRGETQRMIRLVEDIIRLSHLDEGAEGMKREEVDLYDLAKREVSALSQQAEKAHVSIRAEGESAMVSGILQLLQSIVSNLCDNAIKYNRENGSVVVSVKKEGDSVILSVADTGIGIPAEHQERIFERFYRVDKSRSKELGGTGLGLSIVKHAARLHHASIGLQSAEKKGTVITVTFPANGKKP